MTGSVKYQVLCEANEYLLGTYDTLEAAEARVEQLAKVAENPDRCQEPHTIKPVPG